MAKTSDEVYTARGGNLKELADKLLNHALHDDDDPGCYRDFLGNHQLKDSMLIRVTVIVEQG